MTGEDDLRKLEPDDVDNLPPSDMWWIDTRPLHEKSYKDVLNTSSSQIRFADPDDVGVRTLLGGGDMKVKHILMPVVFRTLITDCLLDIHNRSSTNQILQRGIIWGFDDYVRFVAPKVALNSSDISQRVASGDRRFIEGLSISGCNFMVDGIDSKNPRMSVSLDHHDAEAIGSHADKIRIDRQIFHFVLWVRAIRTHPDIGKYWYDKCDLVLESFETRIDERIADINRRLAH
jgi:hypothetical protein